MATFNQQIPFVIPPDYEGKSKPISSIQTAGPDTSLGVGLKAIGEGLEAGAKAYDITARAAAAEEVRDTIQPKHDAYIKSLEAGKETAAAANSGGGYGAFGPQEVETSDQRRMNVLPEQKPVPRELEEFPKRLEVLENARANGTVSRSQYLKDLYDAAKQLRSRYPFHRQFIDAKISEITGEDPANSYMKSLIGDINAYLKNSGDQKKKLISEVVKLSGAELGGASNVVIQKITSGEWTNEQGWEWVHKNNAEMYKLKMSEAKLKNFKGRKELAVEEAETLGHEYGRTISGAQFEAMDAQFGFTNFVEQWRLGNIQPSSGMGPQFRNIVQAHYERAVKLLDEKFNAPGETGTPLTRLIGSAKKKEIYEEYLKPYTSLMSALDKNQPELATYGMQLFKSMSDEETRRLATDEKLGTKMARFDAVSKMAPNLVKDLFNEDLMRGVAQEIKGYVTDNRTKYFTQDQLKSEGVPTTIKSLIEDAKKNKLTEKKKYTMSKVFQIYVDDVKRIPSIVNTNPDIAGNIADAAFSPEGQGVINKFEMDSIESGRRKPGKYSVFAGWTSPEMTQAMFKLGGTRWENYKTWVENTFANDLFSKDIRQLNSYSNSPNMKFEWKSDNAGSYHEIKLIRQPSATARGLGAKYSQDFDEAQVVVNRINSGLRSISHLAKAANMDAEEYMIRILGTSGAKMLTGEGTEVGPGTIMEGIPRKIFNAILANRYANQGTGIPPEWMQQLPGSPTE